MKVKLDIGITRCHGDGCPDKDTCQRHIQITGGILVDRNMKPTEYTVCPYYMIEDKKNEKH
jgi:hypothetical protein